MTATHHNVGESYAYLGEYPCDVFKVHVVEVNSVDTSGGLETPTAIKRIERPRSIQLQCVTFNLRQTFSILA